VFMGLCELPSSSFLRVPASASFASSILRKGETRKGRGGNGKNKELVSNVTPSTIILIHQSTQDFPHFPNRSYLAIV
jgi:hypothetical protein